MNQVKYYFSTTEDGNLSYLVDDLKQNVDKNRQTVADIMEYKDEDLVYMNQIHGNNVQIVDKNSPKIIENCDGIITKEKNGTLQQREAAYYRHKPIEELKQECIFYWLNHKSYSNNKAAAKFYEELPPEKKDC